MHRALVLLAVLLLSISTAAQTLYKSIGPDGNATYSDRAPTEGKIEKTISVRSLPNTAIPEKTLAELQALRKGMKSPSNLGTGVTLFSASWCGYCKQAKAFMASRGIKYSEHDIDTPDGKATFAQAGGAAGIPLLIANGTKLQGFSLQSYESLFPNQQ